MTKFGNEGNCLAACYSTLLGTKIDDFPTIDDSNWQELTTEYLKSINCYFILVLDPFENLAITANIPLILVGDSGGTKNLDHAVIGVLQSTNPNQWHLLHDPDPKKVGIKNVRYVLILCKSIDE